MILVPSQCSDEAQCSSARLKLCGQIYANGLTVSTQSLRANGYRAIGAKQREYALNYVDQNREDIDHREACCFGRETEPHV